MEDFPEDDMPAQIPPHEAHAEKEEVPQELIDKALDDFRARVKGNGFHPNYIALKNFEGEILNFEAYEIFKIETTVGETHATGREQGEIAGSHTDAQQKIAAAIERITQDREIHKQTITLLKKRKDIGYANHGLVIPFDRMNKRVVVHEACNSCQTTGKILCKNCQGKQQINCTKCRGQREEQCHICNGTLYIETPQGRKQCTHCKGRGLIGCTMCRQTGEMPCPKCKSTGKMPCRDCGMTGWNSHIFSVGVKAKSFFDFDRESLPEDVPELIEAYGPALITGEHAEIRIDESPDKEKEMDERSANDEFIIPYHVRLPWGDIAFALKEKDVAAKLFGFQPALISMPPVIRKMAGRGLQALELAASGKGNTTKHLGEALRYRIIGEVFLASLSGTPQKARALMKEKYPYGIEDAALEQMIVRAKKAATLVTKKPRQTGAAISAVISFILFAAYFLSPLRDQIITQTVAYVPQIVPDMGFALTGCILSTATIHMAAAKSLRAALGKIINKNNRGKIMPRLAESIMWGAPATLAVFIAALITAQIAGADLPDWYRQIIN